MNAPPPCLCASPSRHTVNMHLPSSAGAGFTGAVGRRAARGFSRLVSLGQLRRANSSKTWR
jgi:hypothetical protein